jgi:hypothetical protein
MPRRTYHSDRPLPALPSPAVEIGDGGNLPAWDDGALLHDIKSAAVILTQKLGAGYSECLIRRRINAGEWVRNQHWYKTGGRYKISIARVIEWQKNGG